MTNRRMTKKDIASAIGAQNVFNSLVKRGEVDVKNILSTRYVVCGCGEEGCGFISVDRKND
jgi:hypothetical protein